MSRGAAVLLALLAPVMAARSNSTGNATDPINKMCFRWDHQSVVKNNTLWIYGGYETYGNNNNGVLNGNTTQGFNPDLIKIDMSTSWDWKINISEKALPIQPNPQTGTPPPLVVGGWLFSGEVEDENFYLYGGTTGTTNSSFYAYQYPYTDQYTLWSYNTNGDTWGQYDVSDVAIVRPSNGFAAEAPELGLAFYANGEIDAGSAQQTVNLGDGDLFIGGMVVINTTTQVAQNISTTGFSSSGDPRTGGGMVYIPNYGEKGILVALGGQYQSASSYAAADSANFTPMDEIAIYDLNMFLSGNTSAEWYTQSASGNTPPERSSFCTVVVSTPDNSTHNIYVYGGLGTDGSPIDDVYVLSLPSFTWTPVFVNGSSPRYGHTCHVVGQSQMLTVGGKLDNNPCDWEDKGVAILDMSGLIWGSVFTYNLGEYEVPAKVQATIGGGNTTRPAMTSPSGGFNDPAIADLFTGTAVPQPSNKPSHHTNVGAIVGGVVGGVGGALLLALGALLLWLRQRRKRRAAAEDAAAAAKSGGGGDTSDSGRTNSELAGDSSRFELNSQPGVDMGSGEIAELHGTERREIDGTMVQELPPILFKEEKKEEPVEPAELVGSPVKV